MPRIHEYLYTLHPVRIAMVSDGPTPAEERVVGEHFSYLEALARSGAVILAGRTLTSDRSTFGIVILRAGTDAEALRIMSHDPAVAAGVMRAELFPFRVALTESMSADSAAVDPVDRPSA
jgi:uncharacterized protein YciI